MPGFNLEVHCTAPVSVISWRLKKAAWRAASKIRQCPKIGFCVQKKEIALLSRHTGTLNAIHLPVHGEIEMEEEVEKGRAKIAEPVSLLIQRSSSWATN